MSRSFTLISAVLILSGLAGCGRTPQLHSKEEGTRLDQLHTVIAAKDPTLLRRTAARIDAHADL